MIINESKLLNKDEEKYLYDRIFNNSKEHYMEYLNKYYNLINYKYDIRALKDEIKNNKLCIEVNNTVDAIKAINKKNHFKYLGLKANKNNIEELELPLYLINKLIFNMSLTDELAKFENDNISYKNIKYECIGNNKYQIFALIDSYYCISYSKDDGEYYISLYHNDNPDSIFKKFSFIEVYSILADITLKEAVVELIDLLQIKVKSVQEYINIYYCNLETLKDINKLSKYKYFYKRAKSHLYLLEELNKLAINECYFIANLKSIGHVYCSQRYLAKIILKDKIKHNTISSYLNAFSLMGFYKKTIFEENKNNYNNTNSYNINLITEELLNNADDVALLMIKNKKSFSEIDRKYIISNYGVEVSNSIIFDKNIKGGDICA